MNSGLPIPNPGAVSARESLLAPATRTGVLSSPWLKRLGQYLLVAALTFGSYSIITKFLLQSVTVVGSSMIPTLQDSDRYLLNRWIYHLRSPQPTDIVVLRDPMDNGFSVKRIVAVSGDSVWIKEQSVYVNGRKLDEPYLRPGTPTFASETANDQIFQCGADEYFVLGDNRNSSVDSRAYGAVPRGNILGVVIH